MFARKRFPQPGRYFFIHPHRMYSYTLFQCPLLPACIPTDAEGDTSSLHLEASGLRIFGVSLSWWLHTKVWQMFSIRNQNQALSLCDTFLLPVLFISSRQDMEQFPSSVAHSVGLGFCGFYNDTLIPPKSLPRG